MILKLIIVSIVGGILCLDRVFIQVMISRPIICAPLTGLIFGDPYTGLVVGAFIELFWIDRLPIGAYIPPNDTIVAILITGSSIETAAGIGSLYPSVIALSILIFLPVGILAQRLELWLIERNEGLAREALMDIMEGETRSVSRGHMKAIVRYYLLSCGVILLALPAGSALMAWLYRFLSPAIVRGLDLVYAILPLIGVAVVLNTINIRGIVPIFCATFLTATILMSFINGG